jgi:hypothetical protein
LSVPLSGASGGGGQGILFLRIVGRGKGLRGRQPGRGEEIALWIRSRHQKELLAAGPAHGAEGSGS